MGEERRLCVISYLADPARRRPDPDANVPANTMSQPDQTKEPTMPRTISVTLPGYVPQRRRGFLRPLGLALHPESVTAAWYAAKCPPRFRPNVSRIDLLRWRIACFLRGCRA